MSDKTFGSLHKRQIHLRYWGPWGWRALISKYEYRAWWIHHRNENHRCYCQVGRLLDFSLCLAGFGFVVFYSSFPPKEIPCHCDWVSEHLDEIEEEVNHAVRAAKGEA